MSDSSESVIISDGVTTRRPPKKRAASAQPESVDTGASASTEPVNINRGASAQLQHDERTAFSKAETIERGAFSKAETIERGAFTEHVRVETDMRKFNLKVPAFSPEDPEIWFALLEGQFQNFGITEDAVKFNNVITNLDISHAKSVKDIIVNPPSRNRYDKIKSELIKRLTASHERKVRQLLTHEELGDRKPSQFLRHLQDLAGPDVPEDFLKSIWTSRLPQSIQTVLASQTTHDLEQLADLADRIQEISVPATRHVASTSSSTGTRADSSASSEIADLKRMVAQLSLKLDEHTRSSRSPHRSRTQQRRNTSRSRSRSASNYRRYPLCWYHSKFGSQAHKCQKPCDFKTSGNAAGNH